MGVEGLWDILNKAGQSRSLTHVAVVDGFESNTSGRRAYRVGIDASIWYQHSSFAKGGENPELRLLFFRLRSLAELPILPLFVFDGRQRPKIKRGSKMGKSGSHGLTAGMKQLLDMFGMEWRMARGEAEAELAYLNASGVIDAVMTDDADAFVFGATCVIKNSSIILAGNKSNPALNSEGKVSKSHVMVYTGEALQSHPETRVSRHGLVLYALLAGGDYADGVPGFGTVIAHALAQAGFGEQLVDAFERRIDMDIRPFLQGWRSAVHDELRTNTSGLLPRSYPSLRLPDSFPDMDIMDCYVHPVCSARYGGHGGGPLCDTGEMHLPRIAGFCEEHFIEWGYERAIIKRFRDLIWPAAVMRLLRRASLEADEKEKTRRLEMGRTDLSITGALRPNPGEGVGFSAALIRRCLDNNAADRRAAAFDNREPPPDVSSVDDPDPLEAKIVGSRSHVSTDYVLEYRVEFLPSQLVVLARSGIKGTHAESNSQADNNGPLDPFLSQASQASAKAPKKPPPEPDAAMRLWVPGSMLRQAHPALVHAYEATEEASQRRKSGGTRAKKALQADADGDMATINDEQSHANPTREATGSNICAPSSSSAAMVASDSITPARTTVGTSHSDATNSSARPAGSSYQGSRLVRRLLHPSFVSLSDLSQSTSAGSSTQFLFTMPYPDDPSHMEDPLEDPLEDLLEDVFHEPLPRLVPVRTSQPLSLPPLPSSPEGDMRDGGDKDEDRRPQNRCDDIIDQTLGVDSATARDARKHTSGIMPPRKRLRQSSPIASTSTQRSSPKRRQMSAGASWDHHMSDSAVEEMSVVPMFRPVPVISTTPGSSYRRRFSAKPGAVIEVITDSDSEIELMDSAAAGRPISSPLPRHHSSDRADQRPGYLFSVPPSSQASSLGDVIDLT